MAVLLNWSSAVTVTLNGVNASTPPGAVTSKCVALAEPTTIVLLGVAPIA